MSLAYRSTAYIALLLSLVHCNRDSGLLYHLKDRQVVRTDQTTKIKEVVGNNRLDILWVIDNSGSMQQHQQNVIDNTEKFMKAFTKKSHLDWQMGLLSS